jgi:hypothetical protein
MGGSCDCNKQAVVNSRDGVVFILVSCMTWYQLLTLKKVKRLHYFTTKFGLGRHKMVWTDLCGPVSGQLSEFGVTEIFFVFKRTGRIYWLAKEPLLKNMFCVKSLCNSCLKHSKFSWKWLSLDWEFTLTGNEKCQIRRNFKEISRWSDRSRKYLMSFQGKLYLSRKKQDAEVQSCIVPRISAQATKIVALICAIYRNVLTHDH